MTGKWICHYERRSREVIAMTGKWVRLCERRSREVIFDIGNVPTS